MENSKSKRIKLESYDSINEPVIRKYTSVNLNLKIEKDEQRFDKQRLPHLQIKTEIKEEIEYSTDEDAAWPRDNDIRIKCEPIENPTVALCDTCGLICCNVSKLHEHLEESSKCCENVEKLEQTFQGDGEQKCIVDLQGLVQSTKVSINSTKCSFECAECNKEFENADEIKKHLRVHFIRPYSCNMCDKSYIQNRDLIIHKRFHTGEKPFSCNNCNKVFASSRVLKEHKNIHLGIKPFSCDICNKTFNNPSNLKQHNNTHLGIKPFSCDICNKTFTTSSNLRQHKNTHLGIKPFPCNICNNTFATLRQLKHHKNTHLGIKPFSCDFCSKAFTRSSSLKAHKAKHS